MKRLTAVTFALALCLWCCTCLAQYNATIAGSGMDETSSCTASTDCLVKVGSISTYAIGNAVDGTFGVIDTSYYVNMWNGKSYEKETSLGAGWQRIAIVDRFHIYLVSSNATGCTTAHRIYFWDGNSNDAAVLTGSMCAFEIHATDDGALLVSGSVNGVSNAYRSLDGGSTWAQLGTTSINIVNGSYFGNLNYYTIYYVCGIGFDGKLYTFTGENWSLFAYQPPSADGGMDGCVYNNNSNANSNVLAVHTGSGNIDIYNSSTHTWAKSSTKVDTPGYRQSSGHTRGDMFYTISNQPYHFNLVPGSQSMTVSGSLNHCPGFQTCPTNTVHMAKSNLTCPTGDSNCWESGEVDQGGSPTTFISATSWYTTTSCDPFTTDPASCEPDITVNDVLCSASGENLGGPNPPICFIPSIASNPAGGDVWPYHTSVNVYFDNSYFSSNCPGSDWCYVFQGINGWSVNASLASFTNAGLAAPGSVDPVYGGHYPPSSLATPFTWVTVGTFGNGNHDSMNLECFWGDRHGACQYMTVDSAFVDNQHHALLQTIGAHETGHALDLDDCCPDDGSASCVDLKKNARTNGCNLIVTQTVMWGETDSRQPTSPSPCDDMENGYWRVDFP